MTMTSRQVRILAVMLALPGVAAPFLPFAAGTTPFTVAREFSRNWHLWGLAVSVLLAIPIAIWQLRRLTSIRLHPAEIAAACILAVCAMASPLLNTLDIWLDALPRSTGRAGISGPELFFVFTVCSVPWALAFVNGMLFRHARAKGVPREAAAEVFMLGGYLPNALFGLMIFHLGRFWGMNIGAAVVALTCVCYLVTMVLTLRAETPRTSMVIIT